MITDREGESPFNSIVKQSGGSYSLSVQQLDCDMMQEMGK